MVGALGALTAGFMTFQPAAGQDLGSDCGELARVEFATDDWPQLTVELAIDPEARQRGLMFRESMELDHGMLFVFPNESRGGFWMRNTLIPLSIAFVATDGVIVSIHDMQPLDESVHAPPRAYRYALEVNQGWFDEHGVTAGQTMQFCLGTEPPTPR